MKLNKTMLKSNKGFTIQDLTIAIMIFIIFAGTIGGTYVVIYQTQTDTKIDAIATLCTVQIMEYIDKISYESVTTENAPSLIEEIKANPDFDIPSIFTINIDVSNPNNAQDLVKTVKLSVNYTFSGEERSIVIERLKVKEL